MNRDVKQILYIIFAFLGLVLPLYFVAQFFWELGQLDFDIFFAAAFANSASTSLILDLLIVLGTFVVWMIPEARKLKMRNWWMYLLLLGYVSAAFAIPLFLFMRERRLQSLDASEDQIGVG